MSFKARLHNLFPWFPRKLPGRYEAREAGPPLIGVKVGGVWDTYTNNWARGGNAEAAGYGGYVTTYSNAKCMVRRANRLERTTS